MSRGPIRPATARSGWAGRATTVLGTMLVTLMFVWAVLVPPTASAAPSSPFRFSTDGHTWSAQPDPLFQDALITPGARITASLWVRHHGVGAARLSVAATQNHLSRWFTVQVNAVDIPPGEARSGPVLESGDARRLEVEVTLDPEAPLSLRNSAAPLLSHLTIRALPGDDATPVDESASGETGPGEREAASADAGASQDASCGDPTPSALTVAGTTAVGLLVLAVVCALAGWTLRWRARQGRRQVS